MGSIVFSSAGREDVGFIPGIGTSTGAGLLQVYVPMPDI